MYKLILVLISLLVVFSASCTTINVTTDGDVVIDASKKIITEAGL